MRKNKVFINKNYANPPKINFVNNKTKVVPNDDFWSMDLIDWNDYEPKNREGYTYF